MNPKFNIGDIVYCFREKSADVCGFDFCGKVEWVNDTGSGIEYQVTNAPRLGPAEVAFPLLIWESEMELAEDIYMGSVRQHEDSQDWGGES